MTTTTLAISEAEFAYNALGGEYARFDLDNTAGIEVDVGDDGFGLGCLNFTSLDNVENHTAWAEERGLPAPSRTLLIIGAASTVLGAGLVGFALGKPGSC